MRTRNIEADTRPVSSKLRDRRIVMDRRIGYGRRAMVRFDRLGGDRRSGYARRSTDSGFREQFDDE